MYVKDAKDAEARLAGFATVCVCVCACTQKHSVDPCIDFCSVSAAVFLRHQRPKAFVPDPDMSLSKVSKQRLVADPSVGVGDLENVITTFLDETVKQGKVDFLEYTSRPKGISWKSACSLAWLVRLSPLLKLYLGVATNGVLPTKRHKAALEAVASARGLKEKSKKCMADWVDLTDDAIRCALAHLRSLHSCSDTRARAFRRMDRLQQETVQSLLDLLSQGGDEESQAEVTGSGSNRELPKPGPDRPSWQDAFDFVLGL